MLDGDFLFWFAFALLALIACISVLMGLARLPKPAIGESEDVAFYKRQLTDLDREAERGVISVENAATARIEISRRLLHAANARVSSLEGPAEGRRRRLAALAVVLLVPGLTFGLYLAFGSPGVPGLPLYARQERMAPQQDFSELVTKVEAHLREKPDDARGWELLAPIYVRTGRFADAAKARGEILRLSGPSADREADYGEALAAAAQSGMSEDARAAFTRALAIDPKHPKSRFYLALALDQDGKRPEALDALRALMDEAPADAPWRPVVAQAIERLSGDKIAAPSTEGAAAINALPQGDQRAAIAGMVAQLAARLEQNGADFDGWLRLIRAYKVMGEDQKKDEAVAKVRQLFSADADKISRLEALLSGLGG